MVYGLHAQSTSLTPELQAEYEKALKEFDAKWTLKAQKKKLREQQKEQMKKIRRQQKIEQLNLELELNK